MCLCKHMEARESHCEPHLISLNFLCRHWGFELLFFAACALTHCTMPLLSSFLLPYHMNTRMYCKYKHVASGCFLFSFALIYSTPCIRSPPVSSCVPGICSFLFWRGVSWSKQTTSQLPVTTQSWAQGKHSSGFVHICRLAPSKRS